MKGLYINFIIRRRKKIEKVMDYFVVIAIGMIAFVLLFYIPYVNRKNDYNTSYRMREALSAEKTELQNTVVVPSESTSSLEKSYNNAYNEIAKGIVNQSCYVSDIYEQLIPGVTINAIEILTSTSSISLTLTFDTSVSGQEQVNYVFLNKLLDLDWVPTDGIIVDSFTDLTTSWEVLIDGSTES